MGLLSKNKNDSPLDRKELIKQMEEHEQKEAFLLLAARGLLYFIKDFSSDLGEIDDGSFGKEMQALTDVFVPEEKTKTLKSSFDKHKKTISPLWHTTNTRSPFRETSKSSLTCPTSPTAAHFSTLNYIKMAKRFPPKSKKNSPTSTCNGANELYLAPN